MSDILMTSSSNPNPLMILQNLKMFENNCFKDHNEVNIDIKIQFLAILIDFNSDNAITNRYKKLYYFQF